jgi:hypothetical protein
MRKRDDKMTYHTDDEGTYADRWAGFTPNMMDGMVERDDRSVADIKRYPEPSMLVSIDHKRGGFYHYEGPSWAWHQVEPSYVPDTDYDAREAAAYDREQSPNTRTPVSMAEYERERQTATQTPHKSVWGRMLASFSTWCPGLPTHTPWGF